MTGPVLERPLAFEAELDLPDFGTVDQACDHAAALAGFQRETEGQRIETGGRFEGGESRGLVGSFEIENGIDRFAAVIGLQGTLKREGRGFAKHRCIEADLR